MHIVGEFLKRFRVKTCGPNLTKVRIGNQGDGGYIAFQELCEKTPEIYTFGVGSDVSFELDFIEKFPQAKKAFLFDPTITGLPVPHPKFVFQKVGLPQAYYWPGLGEVKPGSLLKIDVEWCEWESLELIDEKILTRFDQILIEFHALSVDDPKNGYSPYFAGVFRGMADRINQDLFARYTAVMDKLLEHYHIFHIHPNNSLPAKQVWICDFPPLLEVSLVRKDLVESTTDYSGPLPIPGLDFPNKTDRPDIENFYPLGRKS